MEEKTVILKTVILIHSKAYGIVIGVTKDFDSAIDFLYRKKYITPKTELYNPFDDTTESDWIPFEEYNLSKDDLKKCGLEIFNDLFDSVFELEERLVQTK